MVSSARRQCPCYRINATHPTQTMSLLPYQCHSPHADSVLVTVSMPLTPRRQCPCYRINATHPTQTMSLLPYQCHSPHADNVLVTVSMPLTPRRQCPCYRINATHPTQTMSLLPYQCHSPHKPATIDNEDDAHALHSENGVSSFWVCSLCSYACFSITQSRIDLFRTFGKINKIV